MSIVKCKCGQHQKAWMEEVHAQYCENCGQKKVFVTPKIDRVCVYREDGDETDVSLKELKRALEKIK